MNKVVHRLLRLVVFSLALSAGASLALAGTVEDLSKTPAMQTDNPAWTQPLIGGGVKGNDAYTDGNLFLVLPAWSTIGKDGTLGGDYLFLEPYSSLGEQGEIATSLGLGWRHLFSDEPISALQKQGMARFMEEGWFIGGNVFVDMLDTQHNNNFWQMGVGAEIGSRYLELRGNYYIPMTGEKLYDRQVNTQSFSSSSTSLSSQDTFGNPLATGNSIVQPVSSLVSATTTTSTTTVRTVTELFEKGMKGWDAEASVLVPWVDQWMDLRISAGYLSFDNQPFGPQNGPTGPVHGWKSGVELRPVPAVVLGGDWYADKRFTGSNWIVSAELQIPMDHTWKDAFKVRRRHLVEHIAEPVHRQNDAIKIGNEENQQSSSSTSVARVTKVVSQSATNVVLKDDVVFVNNGGPVGNGIQAGSTTGNGTAEKPVNTVQAGSTLAGANSTSQPGHIWTAYVQGGGPTYTEEVMTTTGSVHYFGSSQLIQGMGGKSFGGGANPVIDGSIVANASTSPAVKLVSVQGFTIQHGTLNDGTSPIDMSNVSTVMISNNIIQNAYSAGINVAVASGFSTNATIASNTITNSQAGGIGLEAFANNASLTALVQSNIISGGSGDGIAVLATGGGKVAGAQVNATILGNTITGQTHGISFEVDNDGTAVTALVQSNTITGGGNDAIVGDTNQASTLTLTANNNVISNGPQNGVDLAAFGSSGISFSGTGNTITDMSANGFLVTATGQSQVTAGFFNNTIFGVTGDGIRVVGNTDSSGDITAKNNMITSPHGNGIYVESQDNALFSANLVNNTIGGAGVSGIKLVTGNNQTSTSGLLPSIQNNLIIGPAVNGIDVSSGGSSTVTGFITDNSIFNAGGMGVSVQSTGTSQVALNVDTNAITNSVGSGIFIQDSNTIHTGIQVFVDNNVINGTTGATGTFGTGAAGIQLVANGTGFIAAEAVSGNTISNTAGDGISLSGFVFGAAAEVSEMNLNTISNTGLAGISVFAFGQDVVLKVDLMESNTISNTGHSTDGISLVAGFNMSTNAQVNVGDVSFNTITNTSGHGIFAIGQVGGDAFVSTITHNTINGTGLNGTTAGDGILLQAFGGSLGWVDVSNNTISNVHGIVSGVLGSTVTGVGIHVEAGNGTVNALIPGAIRSNTISNTTGDGILIEGDQSTVTVGNVNLNTITNSTNGAGAFIADSAGIHVVSTGSSGNMAVTSIDSNTIIGGAGSGIETVAGSSGTLTVTSISSNNISNITGQAHDGIFTDANSGGSNTVTTMASNTVTNAGSSGMVFQSDSTGMLDSALKVSGFDKNTVSGTPASADSYFANQTGASTLKLNGTLDAAHTNISTLFSGSFQLQSSNVGAGNMTGNFYLNNVFITLPQTVP